MISLMSRLSLAALAASATLTAGLAGSARGAAAGPALPPGWTHVSVNVIIRHVPHTLVYDRGRIIAVTPTSLTLRERDGSVWVITVAPTAQITLNGQPAALAQLRRAETATTVSVDGGAATKVTVRAGPALAAAVTRR
jgi:hypothetical protein